MPSEAEWKKAYDHLVARLRSLGAEQVVREIEEAAAMPVKRTPSTNERMLLAKMAKRELGQTALEPPTPKDMFITGLLVLEARLIHLPALLGGIRNRLKRKNVSFFSEYATDLSREDEENQLLAKAVRVLPESADLKRATETLMSLVASER